jgi:hypothetical protein
MRTEEEVRKKFEEIKEKQHEAAQEEQFWLEETLNTLDSALGWVLGEYDDL